MDAMVERIEKLERSVRRFRWAGGAVACLAVVGLVMGQKAEPNNKLKMLKVDKIVAHTIDVVKVVAGTIDAGVLEAEAYALMDDNNLRGVWDTKDNTSTGLTLFPGTDEGPRMSITVNADGAAIKLYASKDTRSSWSAYKDGSTGFLLRVKDDKDVGGLWMSSPDTGTSLSLRDKEGRLRAVLGRFGTREKKTDIIHKRPESSLLLFNSEGDVVHESP